MFRRWGIVGQVGFEFFSAEFIRFGGISQRGSVQSANVRKSRRKTLRAWRKIGPVGFERWAMVGGIICEGSIAEYSWGGHVPPWGM